jgi:hypothetical protein
MKKDIGIMSACLYEHASDLLTSGSPDKECLDNVTVSR